ncbi:unnamed protein product [Phytophthora lilii]|uniref:Unnamed protein product n=1 Tax=Phytophthora lilii TaxID=2077276 RepID=A0A9W6WZV2_9STRA|nr:unnamed protein product [Phytophthora lilii]
MIYLLVANPTVVRFSLPLSTDNQPLQRQAVSPPPSPPPLEPMKFFTVTTSLWMALQALSVTADEVTYDWRVTPAATAFDGIPTTSYGINDRPSHEAIIEAELGQDVEVPVTNELNESTCLHWHGLRQLGTQEMDGVPGVTQCDIPPKVTATYRFTPDKAGSFWWHSHHGTQYAFGLRGPLIVHAPENELESWERDVEEEYTIQLDDIYHTMPTQEPIWDTVLINNLGATIAPLLPSTTSPTATPISRSSTFASIMAKSQERECLQQQSYGLLLDAGQGIERSPVDCCRGLKRAKTKVEVGEFDFVPLIPAVPPAKAADRAVLEYDMRHPAPNQPPLGYFSIDGGNYSLFKEPKEPPLFTIAGGLSTAQLPTTANARSIEYGKHVEVVLVNDMKHPFHMHTHAPWTVGSGTASIEDIRNDNLPPLKLMMRDVYTVPPCHTNEDGDCVDVGYLVLRFTADNPGVWIMHCHIDWHLADGLAMVFVEGEGMLQKAGVDAFSNSVLSVCNSTLRWTENILLLAESDAIAPIQSAHSPISPEVLRMWDSVTINSLGRYNCTSAASHGYTECNSDQPLSRFKFEAGKNFRSLQPTVNIWSRPTKSPRSESTLATATISSSRLNAASDSAIRSFWIRATALYGLPWTAGTASIAGDGFNYEGLAVVYYEDDNTDDPTSSDWTEITTINEFEFTPIETSVLPTVPSECPILEFDFRRGLGYFSIDGADYLHFTAPDESPLFTIAAGLKTEELPATTLARKIEYGKHIEVVLVNDMNEQHPFHMHTHAPWVVGSGTASLADIQAGNLNLKLSGPMKRDVYTVPPCDTDDSDSCTNHGYVVLRFTADNPGVWIIHCHI